MTVTGEHTNEPVEGLGVRLDGAVLRLTLDRPDRRNALTDTMVAGLIDALDAAGRDERVRAVLLTGAGDHFCGGADIVARNAPGGRRPRVGSIQRRVPSLAHRLIELVCTVQVPIVCAVRGWAAGIGLHLAVRPTSRRRCDAWFWEPFAERVHPTAARPGCCPGSSARCGPASCCCSAGPSTAPRPPSGA